MTRARPQACIEWKEAYSVGGDAIDQHQQQLVALISELHEAVTVRTGSKALRTILGELKAGVALFVLGFLKDWQRHHIQKSDQKYEAFLQANVPIFAREHDAGILS